MIRMQFMVLLIAALILPSLAEAQQFDVILSEDTPVFTTNTNSDIGGVDSSGAPNLIQSLFSRPVISSNGRYIGLEVDLTETATDDAAVVVDLQTGTVTLLAQEGISGVPGSAPDLYDSIGGSVEVNDSGHAAFFADTDGATAADNTVNFWDGTTLSVVAREGDPSPVGAPDVQIGSTFFDVQLTNAGDIGGDFDAGPAATLDDYVSLGSTVLLAGGATPPAGYVETNAGTLNNNFGEVEVSGNGAHYIIEGDTNDDTLVDAYLFVDGALVAQEGQTTHLSADGMTSLIFDNIADSDIGNNGDWIAEATTGTENGPALEYTLVNGVAVEIEGQSASNGSTFESLIGVSINGNGDYVSVWGTDGATVLLVNSEVFLTEGDVLNVDYNGDGVFEDLVVDLFSFEDFDLADDGTLTLIIDFDDLDGNQVGDALLTVNINAIPEPSTLGLLSLAGVFALARRRRS